MQGNWKWKDVVGYFWGGNENPIPPVEKKSDITWFIKDVPETDVSDIVPTETNLYLNEMRKNITTGEIVHHKVQDLGKISYDVDGKINVEVDDLFNDIKVEDDTVPVKDIVPPANEYNTNDQLNTANSGDVPTLFSNPVTTIGIKVNPAPVVTNIQPQMDGIQPEMDGWYNPTIRLNSFVQNQNDTIPQTLTSPLPGLTFNGTLPQNLTSMVHIPEAGKCEVPHNALVLGTSDAPNVYVALGTLGTLGAVIGGIGYYLWKRRNKDTAPKPAAQSADKDVASKPADLIKSILGNDEWVNEKLVQKFANHSEIRNFFTSLNKNKDMISLFQKELNKNNRAKEDAVRYCAAKFNENEIRAKDLEGDSRKDYLKGLFRSFDKNMKPVLFQAPRLERKKEATKNKTNFNAVLEKVQDNELATETLIKFKDDGLVREDKEAATLAKKSQKEILAFVGNLLSQGTVQNYGARKTTMEVWKVTDDRDTAGIDTLTTGARLEYGIKSLESINNKRRNTFHL